VSRRANFSIAIKDLIAKANAEVFKVKAKAKDDEHQCVAAHVPSSTATCGHGRTPAADSDRMTVKICLFLS